MTTNTTILPLRSLNSDKEKGIKNFYSPASGAGLFLATYLPVVLCLSIGGAFFTVTAGLMAGVAIAIIWVIIRQQKIKRNIAQAKFVYQYGDEEELRFSSIASNFSYKVNGSPQQIISLVRNGKPMQVKTFNPNVVAVYCLPQQTVYAHPQYPNIMVPEGLFDLQWPAQKSTATVLLRRALVFVLPFVFVFGLIYFINSEMGSHSETHAQPDALIYRLHNHLVFSSVVSSFKAYEVSNKGVYGNNYCYAEAMDLETGKPLWKVTLDAKNNKKSNVGAARLLGESQNYLFFLRNDLYVINKEDGKITAQNKDFKNIEDKMSKEMITSYEDEANYTWNDSLKAVVVKGTDGLFYTIDGQTLQTGTIDIADPDHYFMNNFKWGNNYEDQISAVYDDGNRCLTLLDAQDTVLLAHNSNGVEERSAKQSVRRMLFSCPSDTLSAGWTTLNKNVFLFGGFLVDATQIFHQPDDTLASYLSYQSLTARYNHRNPPMRTGNGDFLIMHKTSIEPAATLLLTAVSPNGTTLWQVSTGYGSVPLMYKDSVANNLYLFGNTNGAMSDDVNQVLCINLQTGTVKKNAIR